MAIRTWVDDAVYYRSLGLSVIPLQAESKQPLSGFKWKEFQSRIASETEIEEWFSLYPHANLGIVCGTVSGGLQVCDIDDLHFRDWILPHLTRLGTLVTRTGSNKLHIYLRSTDHLRTTAYNHKGIRVADIKGEGSYVVAPPSRHPDGGFYVTMLGDFEHIKSCPDARTVYDALYAAYLGTDPTPPEKDEARYTDRTVNPALIDDEYDDLVTTLGHLALSSRIKQAIFDPAVEPGIGEWLRVKSQSEIDYAVCAQLHEAGLSDEQIESVFASLPIGAKCYRVTSRPNHGRGYLARTLDNVREKTEAKEDAKQQEVGRNFKLLRVKRIDTDDPQFELTLEISGQEKVATLTGKELWHISEVKSTMGLQLNFVPKFAPALLEKGGGDIFAEVVFHLAEREEVPESATQVGVVKFGMLKLLRESNRDEIPLTPQEMPLCWTDLSKNLVLIDGDLLVSNIGTKLRPSPAAHEVWRTVRALGGGGMLYQFPDGSYRDLWYLPPEVLA